MKTQVHTNSIEAFTSLSVADYLSPKERAVMAAFINDTVVLTRQQLSERIGMPINAVCGRVNSLVTKHALVPRGTRKDPLTRKSQELLGLPVPVQGNLFGMVA